MGWAIQPFIPRFDLTKKSERDRTTLPQRRGTKVQTRDPPEPLTRYYSQGCILQNLKPSRKYLLSRKIIFNEHN